MTKLITNTCNLQRKKFYNIGARSVLTKAELEGLPLDGSLKDDVEKGKVREPYSFNRQASIVN